MSATSVALMVKHPVLSVFHLSVHNFQVLGLSDTSQTLELLPENEKGTCTIRTLGGVQKALTVNEPGLYRVVFKSRKPAAEAFQYWVVHEVLPSIMRTGAYSVPTNPGDLSGTHVAAMYELAASTIRKQGAQIVAQQQQLSLQSPKVESFDDLMESKGSYSWSTTAKLLARTAPGLGPQKLIRMLLEQGVIFHPVKGRPSEYLPKQDQLNTGRFLVITDSYDHPHGGKRPYTVMKVTPKGLEWLRTHVASIKGQPYWVTESTALAAVPTTDLGIIDTYDPRAN